MALLTGQDRLYHTFFQDSLGRWTLRVNDSSDIDGVSATVIEYDNVVSVASGATVDVLDYTLVSDLGILAINFSGDNRAIYTLKVNDETKEVKRLYYTDYNGSFDLLGFSLISGDNIKVSVENRSLNIGSFDCTLYARSL